MSADELPEQEPAAASGDGWKRFVWGILIVATVATAVAIGVASLSPTGTSSP
jgi:hypothetical protein